MSISQLQVDRAQNVKPLLPQTEFVEPKLPARDLTRYDAIQPYDPQAAASASGQSLRTILSTINRAQVRYVGIVATDTRDVVFLNQLLHRECPDVQVFTTEPSVALLHPEEAYHLRGMVVGSTYPLHPITEYWGGPKKGPSQMIPFPTQASQGYYNAVLAHHQAIPNATAPGDERDLLLGYHPPKFEFKGATLPHPPVWISVVGENGQLIPVHCYTDFGTTPLPPLVVERQCDAEQDAQLPPKFSIPIAALLASGSAVIVLLVALIGLVALDKPADTPPSGEHPTSKPWDRIPERLKSTGRWIATVFPSYWEIAQTSGKSVQKWVWERIYGGASETGQDKENGRDEKKAADDKENGKDEKKAADDKDTQPCENWACFWRIVLLGGLLLFALPYALPALELLQPCCGLAEQFRDNWRHWTMFWFAVAVVAEVGAIAFLVYRRSRGGRLPSEVHRLQYVLLGVTVLVGVALLAWWFGQTVPQRFFFYFRARDFSSGLSPVVPMGLLGAALATNAWGNLQQLSDKLRRPPLSFLHQTNWGKTRWASVAHEDEELQRHYDHPGWLLEKRLILVLIVALLLSSFAIWNVGIISLPSASPEGWTWDVSMRGLLWAAAALVVLTLVRFLVLASQLKSLLEEIAKLPLAGAFERLPDAVRRLFRNCLWFHRHVDSQLATIAWVLPRLRPLLIETDFHEDRQALVQELNDEVGAILEEFPRDPKKWTVDAAFGQDNPPASEQPKHPKHPEAEKGGAAVPPTDEDVFLAALVVVYVGRYFAQLRMLLLALALSAPLLLLTVASYPFQPVRQGMFAMLTLLGAVVVSIVHMLWWVNRDPLVSRITGTTPGRFTPDAAFFTNFATYVVPLATLALLQVLGLVRFVLEPLVGLFE